MCVYIETELPAEMKRDSHPLEMGYGGCYESPNLRVRHRLWFPHNSNVYSEPLNNISSLSASVLDTFSS